MDSGCCGGKGLSGPRRDARFPGCQPVGCAGVTGGELTWPSWAINPGAGAQTLHGACTRLGLAGPSHAGVTHCPWLVLAPPARVLLCDGRCILSVRGEPGQGEILHVVMEPSDVGPRGRWVAVSG